MSDSSLDSIKEYMQQQSTKHERILTMYIFLQRISSLHSSHFCICIVSSRRGRSQPSTFFYSLYLLVTSDLLLYFSVLVLSFIYMKVLGQLFTCIPLSLFSSARPLSGEFPNPSFLIMSPTYFTYLFLVVYLNVLLLPIFFEVSWL